MDARAARSNLVCSTARLNAFERVSDMSMKLLMPRVDAMVAAADGGILRTACAEVLGIGDERPRHGAIPGNECENILVHCIDRPRMREER